MTSSSFRIDGELTIYRAAELAVAMKTALAGVAEGGALELDLSEVAEMDCAGVQLLLAARRSATESGRSLRLAGRSAAVDEVLAILRLTGHFGDAVAGTH
ncbi:MAG TPA: STAS domain-containing protein [Burkholderiaceae bacterium]